MKATELQIGDLVKIKGHLDYDKVQEIARDENMQWYISFACSMTLFRAYEFEPIPITPEILEKNGFERSVIIPSKFYRNIDNERLIFCPHSSCYDLGYVHWNESNDVDIMHRLEVQQPIMYIHQMQHALRLFGLDQLADNFKV